VRSSDQTRPDRVPVEDSAATAAATSSLGTPFLTGWTFETVSQQGSSEGQHSQESQIVSLVLLDTQRDTHIYRYNGNFSRTATVGKVWASASRFQCGRVRFQSFERFLKSFACSIGRARLFTVGGAQ